MCGRLQQVVDETPTNTANQRGTNNTHLCSDTQPLRGRLGKQIDKCPTHVPVHDLHFIPTMIIISLTPVQSQTRQQQSVGLLSVTYDM